MSKKETLSIEGYVDVSLVLTDDGTKKVAIAPIMTHLTDGDCVTINTESGLEKATVLMTAYSDTENDEFRLLIEALGQKEAYPIVAIHRTESVKWE